MSEEEPRAGDHVHHVPSGEHWVVAHVSNGMLAWCGWPGGMVKLSECRVIKRCSDDEHLKLVNEIANMSDGDFRASHAQLGELMHAYARSVLAIEAEKESD